MALLASVIISGKVDRRSALHPRIMDQARYNNDNSAMADYKMEIRWEDGQRLLISHNEDEREIAMSQFLELEPTGDPYSPCGNCPDCLLVPQED